MASTRIQVRVVPRGGRNGIDGWDGDVLRVRVTAPPADGAANAAVVALLAKHLGVSKSAISIVSGATSRTKVIEVSGMSADALKAATEGP